MKIVTWYLFFKRDAIAKIYAGKSLTGKDGILAI